MSNESGKHVQELLDQFDLELPLERARTIPSSWYLDREMYALECRAIFGNTWQAIGRVDQVAAAETFFTADLAGEPIVVVRDGQGELRAFYNVCRHRAARVVAEAAQRLNADVLVIARGSAAGALGRLRANAYSIIRQSPCPVVSV